MILNGDTILAGISLSTLVMLLVQALKVVGLPSKYAPQASLAAGFLAAWLTVANGPAPIVYNITTLTTILIGGLVIGLTASGLQSSIAKGDQVVAVREATDSAEKAALVAVTTPPVVVQPAPLPPVQTTSAPSVPVLVTTPPPAQTTSATPFVPDPADE